MRFDSDEAIDQELDARFCGLRRTGMRRGLISVRFVVAVGYWISIRRYSISGIDLCVFLLFLFNISVFWRFREEFERGTRFSV